jgi:hydrogenase maturation protease
MKTLVLGLGNELIADDGVAIRIARILSQHLKSRDDVDVLESSQHGLALIDLFSGYDKAIIVDAIKTGAHKPGSVVTMSSTELSAVEAPSPHFTGVPEMIRIAQDIGLPFPKSIQIVAIEVVDQSTVGGPMTLNVEKAIPDAVAAIDALIYTTTSEILAS